MGPSGGSAPSIWEMSVKYTAFGIGILVAVVFVAASSAPGMIVSVSPGPGTPLRDAIAAARPGDTLRIGVGRTRR